MSVIIATFNHARYLSEAFERRQAPKLLGLCLLRRGKPARTP